VLLLARAAANHPIPRRPPSAFLHEPGPLEEALRRLAGPTAPCVDWGPFEVRPVYRVALRAACWAEHLARKTGRCDPEEAWACGLLAPLGWLAVCAADPEAAAGCLADSSFARDPLGAQERHWGLGHAALARRLARRWGLPGWLAAVVGHLALPPDTAEAFGADPALFHVARLAARHAQREAGDLGLPGAEFAAEAAQALGLPPAEADAPGPAPAEVPAPAWEPPAAQPLLRDLLAVAAENRRLRDVPLQERLEREVDALHRSLEEEVRRGAERLRERKLEALAEFAAGAGHEINNPLAVILGQAQYMLGHAAEWFPGDAEGRATKSLQGIVAQTRRVHGLLRDLMQYARPAPPEKSWFDLPALLGEVAAGLNEPASQRGVRVEVLARPDRLAVHADPEQVRTALACLLRNAVEAAPAGGWARLALEPPPPGGPVEVAVEDDGPGPDPASRESLFDPLFSGRSAGRGRGLGLPIAWRLARQQGGDVRLEPARPQGPTRFVLSLPAAPPEDPVLPFPAAPQTDPVALAPAPGAEIPAAGCTGAA
jgi:signal transduction histidine kinase